MTRIRAKLNSKRGVSIVLALLLLLVCAFAGTAAITAASSNIVRYEESREYQQEYLAVSSAAKLLIDQIAEGNGKISATYPAGNLGAPQYLYDGLVRPNDDTLYFLIWDDVQDLLYTALYNDSEVACSWAPDALTLEPYVPDKRQFEITVENDEVFKPVNVTMTYDTKGLSRDSGQKVYVDLECNGYKLAFEAMVNARVVEISDAKAVVEIDFITVSSNIQLPS